MIKTIPYLIIGAILVYTNYHLRKKNDKKDKMVDQNIDSQYLVDYFPKSILFLNSKNKIVRYNQQFLKEFGFDEKEIKNKGCIINVVKKKL
jgi:regulatory protein YycI of two-component signal transduction system YycFG